MSFQAQNDPRVTYALAVFDDAERKAVADVLATPMIGHGPKSREFEARIAGMFGKRHGIFLNSGSSANLLAMEILDLPEGSEVITPILTFSTTIAPLLQKGLVPAFVDVVPGEYLLDIDQVESMITKSTRALMVPSLIGNIPDFRRLSEIAERYRLWLIEDSCDTLGATLYGNPTGAYTHMSTTSFYASHIITAAGGGGMLCVNNDSWRELAKMRAGWGRSSATNESETAEERFNQSIDGIPYDGKFVFKELGYNFQSTDIQAAFGLAQLEKFPTFHATRKRRFAELLEFFRQYEAYFVLPRQHPAVDTAWLAFPLVVKTDAPFSRHEFVRYLEGRNIQTRPIFTGNALRQPAFRGIEARTKPEGYPVADQVMRGSVLIGCHQGITDEQMAHVKGAVASFLNQRTLQRGTFVRTEPTPVASPTAMSRPGAWQGKRVLVTGATGAIGSRLTERLEREGAIVTKMSKRSGGEGYLHVDLSDPAAVDAALSGRAFDAVFHLAAAGVTPGADGMEHLMRQNALGTENLLAALRELPACPVVVAGSWTEYGPARSADGFMHEDDPCQPLSPYGMAKLASTRAAQAWARREGRPLTVLRFFHVVGGNEPQNRFGPTVVRALLRHERPKLFDPAMRRDFVHVDDVVEAMLRAAALREQGAIMNVGTGIATSLHEFVSAIQTQLGTSIEPEIVAGTGRPWDVPVARASVERIETALGWKPRPMLQDLIPKLLREYHG